MSQIAHSPAYALIEDRLDEVGQKYRIQRWLRGIMLFVACAAGTTFAAIMAAHFIGQSKWNYAVVAAWGAWLAASLWMWFLRPMMIRPRPIDVARMIEGRVEGLHNGLTNAVLLARAKDLDESPWVGRIVDEIAAGTRDKPLGGAVRLSDLKGTSLRCAAALAALLLAVLLPQVRDAMLHGWRQLFNPAGFVPRIGRVEIVSVRTNAPLISGTALEITIRAHDPAGKLPAAQIVFEGAPLEKASVPATQQAGDDDLHYTYRLENVRDSFRFHVDIEGSQSAWNEVKVVRDVKLAQLSIRIDAPAYTRQPTREILLKGDDAAKAPISAPEGSTIQLAVKFDVQVTGAMLRLGAADPAEMRAEGNGYSAAFTLLADTALQVMPRVGEQIVSSLPASPLVVSCVKDAAPVVEMKWPAQDMNVPIGQEIKVAAAVHDDYGLATTRLLCAFSPDEPLAPVDAATVRHRLGETSADFVQLLAVDPARRKHGMVVRLQVESTDNRDIAAGSAGPALGAQVTLSPVVTLTFRDPAEIAKDQKEQIDQLMALLRDMLDRQVKLNDRTVAWKKADKAEMAAIGSGQSELRDLMAQTAEKFPFDASTKRTQKVLMALAVEPAREAVELAAALRGEAVVREQARLQSKLQERQTTIIQTLKALLSGAGLEKAPATMPTTRRAGDLDPDRREAFQKLDEALKKFMAEEKRILDQTAALAKKPVDNWDEADKKLAEELKMAQEKLDAFMQEKVSDVSKLAEQDMSNAALLKELLEVYSEATMAKDALKKQAVEMAIPAEEMGLEAAKELSSNIEKWLSDSPDRQKWMQEDPLAKSDTPMPELPKELEDMVGKLLEEQEDLFDDIEDSAANWADSMDKGIGWDAMDGPIADMSAKGVTGNQLPNNNEMNGRSGEGRSGKSSGEMVEDTASGKGGRNTPTRLDPTPFQKGQVKDESKDPTGGATGGGKLSGQGGQGLEGPVGPKQKEEMQRLAQRQAELRNEAERLMLKFALGNYDSFKLLQAIINMRQVESDLNANRYQNAMRKRDVTVESMETSKALVSGEIHTQHDTTPQAGKKELKDLSDAMRGNLPAAWKNALQQYFKKLAEQ